MDKQGYVDNEKTLPTYPTLDHREPSRGFAYGLRASLAQFHKNKVAGIYFSPMQPKSGFACIQETKNCSEFSL